MPQGLFVWYEVTTDAPDAVRAFYEGVIGWRIADPSPGHETAAIDYRHIYRADGAGQGGMLVLRPEMIAAGARPWWVPYLMVDSVPDTLAAITADGARVWMPPTTIAEGTFAMVADPWGAPFYLIDPTPPPGQDTPPPPVFALDITQAVTWNELFTTDLPGARTFYARHFGFTYPDAMPMGAFGDYQFIAHPPAGPRRGDDGPPQRRCAAGLAHLFPRGRRARGCPGGAGSGRNAGRRCARSAWRRPDDPGPRSCRRLFRAGLAQGRRRMTWALPGQGCTA